MCICQQNWSGSQCDVFDVPFCKECMYNSNNNKTSCLECKDGYNLNQSRSCSKLITLFVYCYINKEMFKVI